MNKQDAGFFWLFFFFFKGAAVSLPNVADTFDMTNEHRTAKLQGKVGGQLQPLQTENNVSEHQAPFVPT